MTSLIGRIFAGAVAGAVGTLAMDLIWYRRYQRGGGDESFSEWEFAASTSSFDEAAAPGKVGQKLADAVGVDLPDERAGETTNVMHWLTGAGYGVGHALLQHRRGLFGGALATGLGAFANSYVMLGTMGIYQPIWEYDANTLLEDLSAHVVFGAGTAITYRALTDRS